MNDVHTVTIATAAAGSIEGLVRIRGVSARIGRHDFSGEPDGDKVVDGRWNTYHVAQRLTPEAVILRHADGRVERVELAADGGARRWAVYAAVPIIAMLASGIARTRAKKARASQ